MTLLLALVISSAPATAADGAPADVRNLAGAIVNPLEPQLSTKAVVLVFISIDCPVSNRYAPDIKRLVQEFASRGVRVWLVYPNPGESVAAIRAHLHAFGYPDIALRDPDHQLVARAGISVTPEAAVFTSTGELAYRGRIDDRYVELGRERPVPTRHDLTDALAATLAGRPVRPATTQAFGCFVADMK